MTRDIDTLKPLFHDEDTDTWVQASRAIGALGQAAEPLLAEFLAHPDDIHARRHSWCVLGAYLEAVADDVDTVFRVAVLPSRKGRGQLEQIEAPVRSMVREVLAGAVVEGLAGSDVALARAADLTGFEQQRRLKIEELEAARRDKAARLEAMSNPKARAGLQGNIKRIDAALTAWQDDRSTFASIAAIGSAEARLPRARRIQEWCFGSLVAGLSLPLLQRLGVPLPLLAVALARLSAEGGDRIAYAKNLPRLLVDPEVDPRDERLTALVQEVLATLSEHLPSPLKSPVHWVEHLIALREVAQRWRLDLAVPQGRGLDALEPAELARGYGDWLKGGSEQAAIELARACEATFDDDLRWREKSERERLALPTFFLVVLFPLAKGGRTHRFDLAHRLELVRRAIHDWQARNPAILAVLVRAWKLLLNQQLEATSSPDQVLGVCLRQVQWIEPLVARWNLRSIVLKDLATIAARALCRCYLSCSSRTEPRYDEYLVLLYSLLHALPEQQMLREMALYAAASPEVQRHLEAIKDVLLAGERDELDDSWARYGELLWSLPTRDGGSDRLPRHRDVDELAAVLRNPSGNRDRARDESDGRWQSALEWMLLVRENARVQAEAGGSRLASKGFLDEMKAEVGARAGASLAAFDALVMEAARLEYTLADPGEALDVLETIRAAIGSLRELRQLCREQLPIVERSVVDLHLEHRGTILERRFTLLSSVLETEDEARALAAMGLKDPDWAAYQPTPDAYSPSKKDRRLLTRWMVKRHMLRELAGRSAILGRLTSLGFVASWIAAPYLLCFLLVVSLGIAGAGPRLDWLRGLPFLLAPVAGLALVALYLALPDDHHERRDRATLLLPHMVGALFLGIMERFAADETWSLAVLGSPIIRGVNLAIFLGASYFFVRHVMIHQQRPKARAHRTGAKAISTSQVLRRRALSLLAMGFWLSFLFITVYSLLMGGVMSGPGRAELAAALAQQADPVASWLGHLIPPHIPVSVLPGGPTLIVFPWAILSWTVQLFFFSAIFERIMNRGE